MNVVLGLNLMHADTSAALVVDGEVVAAISEERLGARIKHTSKFPMEAISFVLEYAGLSMTDVDYVAVARDPKANLREKVRWSLTNLKSSIPAFIEVLARNTRTEKKVNELKLLSQDSAGEPKFKFYPVEHHVAHISSSFYCTDTNEEYLGISYDASGDFVSVMTAICKKGEVLPSRRIFLPSSLGLFYTAMCQFIGFDRFGEEYKVMGLAPYGEDLYREEMEKVISLKACGGFDLNPNYIRMHSGGRSGKQDDGSDIDMDLLYKPALSELLGRPLSRTGEDRERQINIAKSTQMMFERAALNYVEAEVRKHKATRLVMAGGSALNGVTNAKIYSNVNEVESVYLHPAAGDDGTAVGAALYCYNKEFEKINRYRNRLFSPYLGSEHSQDSVRNMLESQGLAFDVFSDEELYEIVAEKILDSQVIGWFQGRSEWGPRALGNRSILADATNPRIKEIINSKIKRRESFRPFAPSVLEEDVGIFFEQDIKSPYMMHVVKFRDEWRAKLPGVVHVDGTGRLQSVSAELNPRYHQLISTFKKRSGVGILLNTSFNENEPIVETPEQALSCFLRTDMDSLVLGNVVVSK